MNGMLTVVQGKPSKAVVDIQYSMLQQNLSIANPEKGIEVKPGSPYTCQLDQGVKLHISQATLGLGSSTRRSILKGAPKDKCAVFLCSLMLIKIQALREQLVEKFGIDPNNAFAFWDWVGGRHSVCSAFGVLPLSLQYGFTVVEKFLKGASSIDQHFYSAPLELNIPVLLGLLSVCVSFLGYPARAILPYSQALEKLAPHIQQVSMESNGKSVSIDGVPLPFETGEIDFGEPGTNGQNSFYQLIHQRCYIELELLNVCEEYRTDCQVAAVNGRVIPCKVVSNHDELMPNFFAQPDALAYGKLPKSARIFNSGQLLDSWTPQELQNENVPPHLIPHKFLLAIYEHRIAVQGFIWGINSFDQWGVELGKSLASQVRRQLHASRKKGEPVEVLQFQYNSNVKKISRDVPPDPPTLIPHM
ncbi:unnamed protein product [Camellia sinensis]